MIYVIPCKEAKAQIKPETKLAWSLYLTQGCFGRAHTGMVKGRFD